MEYNCFYVYALVDPLNRMPFYVGKGKGNRAWQHLSGSEVVNEHKLSRINAIREAGEEVDVVILADALLEKVALRIEAYYINALPGLTNIVVPAYSAYTYPDAKLELPDRVEDVKCFQHEH